MYKGIWILKKWKKSQSLTQLSLADASNPEDSFLYKLSQAPVTKTINFLLN